MHEITIAQKREIISTILLLEFLVLNNQGISVQLEEKNIHIRYLTSNIELTKKFI